MMTTTSLGTNLIFNGGAEHSSGHRGEKDNAGEAGWRDRGSMTVIPYGAPDNLPTAQSPGPGQRGRNFLCGGADPVSEITQVIDVSDLAGDIDAD
jgi:hypothetical protein